jgi:hypothetical protein
MASIIRATTTSGLQVAPDNSGSLELQTNGTTTAVTINTSQNVGIGTTSPSQKLQVSDGGDAGDVRIQLGNTRQLQLIRNATFDNWIRSSSTGVDFYIDQNANANLIMRTNATERMRIDSSGNLYLNTTTRRNNGMQSIDYNGSASGGMGINDTVSSNASAFIAFLTGGTFRGSITNNNNTAVAYNTTSDYRLKENIVPMIGALDTISKLKPVTYTWKQDGSNGQGFIAHELQEIVPDCVTGEKDAVDADGNPKYQGVDTSFLVATLTAAIQEQQTIINDLKARIETLEAK